MNSNEVIKRLKNWYVVRAYNYTDRTSHKKCVCVTFDSEALEMFVWKDENGRIVDKFDFMDFINRICAELKAKVFNVCRFESSIYNDRSFHAHYIRTNFERLFKADIVGDSALSVDLEYDEQ